MMELFRSVSKEELRMIEENPEEYLANNPYYAKSTEETVKILTRERRQEAAFHEWYVQNRIEKMEKKLEEISQIENEIAKKDAEIAKKDAEIAKRDSLISQLQAEIDAIKNS